MKNYSLGLDIGTNSVGWAVVDENNKIVKKNNFPLWGVRMFDEAQDAKSRRSFRSSRRRLERRNQRIKLLKEEFEREIIKVDPKFFQRLADSFFKQEDKKLNNRYTFFDDEYTDKTYFDKYPTIYHLRSHLLKSNEKADIRELYLACHHIIKYRGHFLNEGEKFNKNDNKKIISNIQEINNVINEISVSFEDNYDYFELINDESTTFYSALKDIMTAKYGKNDRKAKLLELFGVGKKTFVNEFIIPLLSGSKIDVSKLTIVKEEKYDKSEIELSSEELESKIDNAKKNVSELASLIDITLLLKEITDYYYLFNLIGDYKYLSDAFVAQYNKHKEQLEMLKNYVRTYCPNEYNKLFRKTEELKEGKSSSITNNYPSYVGMNSVKGKIKRFAHGKADDFYSNVKNIILKYKNEENEKIADKILDDISNNEFLNRQNSSHNSSIPMQLNEVELETILDNQAKYYPFLYDKKDNITVRNRILSIFRYHLPYYVGPLNNNSDRSWVVRTGEKIYPWNYDKVIDMDETAEKFIRRMQNKCSYLKGEDDYCLPKQSLLMSEYNCLSYLNKLKINGSLINKDLKLELLENVFKKKSKPTKKDVENYIKTRYGDAILESNVDNITCDMSSYIKFKEIFKKDFDEKLVEKIISDVVLLEDKQLLKKRLTNLYNLDSNKVKEILKLNYKGYSSLSAHLLANFCSENKETGEIYGPIIEIMRNTNQNLQEILFNDEYNFQEAIESYNKQANKIDDYNDFKEYIDENLYVSPIMKRPLIQAYKIIEEVEKILKTNISKFYIECTRTNSADKEVSKSRYQKVKDLLSSSKSLSYDIKLRLEKELSNLNENQLRSDMLYLYFMQLGKDVYTLENISIDDLASGSMYDIDHIYPQSIIKDDSMNNRVLTSKSFNQNVKKDQFLFEINNPKFASYNDRLAFYNILVDNGLMSKEKCRRLTQKEMQESDLNGFINRQLVVTNQAVKGLISLLKEYKGINDTDIIWSKAENISSFRQKYDILKCREANNYHHAHDAYLNVVVGRVINEYFRYYGVRNYRDFLKMKNDNRTINPDVLFEKDKVCLNNSRVIWNKEKDIETIKYTVLKRFDINETFRTSNPGGLINKVTILPAGAGNIPTKNNLPANKYGGFKEHSFCKYAIIKYLDYKGKITYSLEAIPKMWDDNVKMYIEKNIVTEKIKSFEIINDNIRTNVIIEQGKHRFVVTGKTNDSYYIKNIIDRNFSYDKIKIIKKIYKYNELKDNNQLMENEGKIILSSGKREIVLSNDECDCLLEELKKKYKSNIYNYSIMIKITEAMNKFDNLLLKDKIFTLVELLKLLKTNERKTADLSLIGLNKTSGVIKISKNIDHNMKLYETSITGYYKNMIFEANNEF